MVLEELQKQVSDLSKRIADLERKVKDGKNFVVTNEACDIDEIAEIIAARLKLQNRQNKSNYTEYLEKQLKLLSECSESGCVGANVVADLSLAMVKIVRALQS